jgi:phytoene desaturase
LKKAIVIGAGIAGLASAARLQHKGYQVSVFEHRPYAGGKLTEIMLGKYRFDAGPSVFTMPSYLEDVFESCGKNPKDYFQYEMVDGICNYFWEDGTRLTSYADADKFSSEIKYKLDVDPSVIKKFINKNKFKFETVGNLFLRKSLHRWQSYTNWETIRAVMRIPFLDLFKSMNAVNSSLKHPKLIQIFNRFATYNGSNPYVASGILNLVGHLELGMGVGMPKGGMHDISQSVYKLAQDLGVQFYFGNKVDEIILKNNKATGIRIGDNKYEADIVVCNMDIHYAYEKLMPLAKKPMKVLNQPRSSSGLVFYWGIKKSFPELILHNAFVTNDSIKEFDCIFNKKTISEDPSIYINITSKHLATDAPEGCENWFTMINVPHIEDAHDWDEMIRVARKNIVTKINKILNVNIEQYIEEEGIFEPRIIQERTLSYRGSIYGNSSNTQTSAFFRHSNFSKEFNNLFFCGGSVHPGGGVPVSLSSAKIVCDMISSIS